MMENQHHQSVHEPLDNGEDNNADGGNTVPEDDDEDEDDDAILTPLNSAINILNKTLTSLRESSRPVWRLLERDRTIVQLQTVLRLLKTGTALYSATVTNYRSCYAIGQLPDHCLLAIFEHFSTQELLYSLRNVCHRWRVLIEREVLARKRSLKLFASIEEVGAFCYEFHTEQKDEEEDEDENGYNHNQKYFRLWSPPLDDDLILSPSNGTSHHTLFTLEWCNWIAKIFPSIRYLLIRLHSSIDCTQLPYLLQHWHKALESVTLCGTYNCAQLDDSFAARLLLSIASLQRLKRLNLLMQNNFLLPTKHPDVMEHFCTQILPRLEHFGLYRFDASDLTPILVATLNGNDTCSNSCGAQSLWFDFRVFCTTRHLVNAAKQCGGGVSFGKGLQRLHLFNANRSLIGAICAHLPNIQSLRLNTVVEFNGNNDDDDVLRQFASLHQLITLTVTNITITISFSNFFQNNFPPNIPLVLKSLAKLQLTEFTLASNDDRFLSIEQYFETLGILMPNLRHITLVLLSESQMNNESPQQQQTIEQCLRQNFHKIQKIEILFKEDYLKYSGRHRKRLTI